MATSNVFKDLYDGREEAPLDDELYDFSNQKKLADLVSLNCTLIEKRLTLCKASKRQKAVESMQQHMPDSTMTMTIVGVKDLHTIPCGTTDIYLRVKCGEAVFQTSTFDRVSTDWTSAPMEMGWSEMPQDKDKIATIFIVDEAGHSVAESEPTDVSLCVGDQVDRWVFFTGGACVRFSASRRGPGWLEEDVVTDVAAVEAELENLLYEKR